jgi:hypothetical protein
MWFALKVLAWIAIGLLAWTLVAAAALAFMYWRGWLSPTRSEKVRDYEDIVEANREARDE